MKKLVVLASCWLFGHAVSAQTNIRMCAYQAYQTVEGGSMGNDIQSICDLYQGTPTHASYEEAVTQIDAILDKVGLFRNFEVEECQGINNAIAVTVPLANGDLDRFILYDNLFFNNVSGSTGTDWGLASILAHEVGHHLNGHTLKSGGSNHRIELQADEFSGFVLARMGCSLEDAQAAVNKMLPDEGSATHPAKADRLAAIEKGWMRGNGKTIQVEEIKEEVVTKIVENKVDNEEVKSLLTAEQVLSRYINAIGGQEAIMKIKTLEKATKTNMVWGDDTKHHEITATETRQYLKPAYYFSKSSSGGQEYEMLGLGAKAYMKKPNGKWGEYENEEASNQAREGSNASYILEYALLVNNPGVEFGGIEEVNGKAYYLLKLPAETGEHANDVISEKIVHRYYEVASGLLWASVERTVFKHVSSNEGMIIDKRTLYSDYRTVDGVLFAFKQESVTGSNGVDTSLETVEIESMKTNIPVDASLFTIEDKEIFDSQQSLEEVTKVGEIYSAGISKLHDESSCEEGLQLLEESGKNGFSLAYGSLADIYDNDKTFYSCRKEIPRDDAKVVYWGLKAMRNHMLSAWIQPWDESSLKYVQKPLLEKVSKAAKKTGGLSDGQQLFMDSFELLLAGKTETAFEKLTQSGDAGFVDAQFALAQYYSIHQKPAERVEWLKKAAAQNDPEAIREMAY